MSYRLFLVIGAFSVLALSCNKSDFSTSSNARITWEGDYAVDGCGFFVVIDGVDYKPKNEDFIDEKFKSYNQPVTVEYEKLNHDIESWCYDARKPLVHKGIKIISISK